MGNRKTVVLDTETTGLDPKQGHRLTEIGCVELVDRQLTGRVFQSYFNPERDLDARAAEITGFTRAFLSDKPLFSTRVDELLCFIEGADLIIHNAAFDLSFLNHELNLIQHAAVPLQDHFFIIDTLILAKKRHPGHRYYNLDALCQRYGVNNAHRDKHGALLDAEILAQVYLKMTAGQVSLGFEPGEEDEESRITPLQPCLAQQDIATHVIRSELIKHTALKVVYADAAELAAHSARVERLQSREE